MFKPSKKVKIEDSANKLRDNVYKSMYPSPCSSYDPNKWLQSNDISWLSHSLEQDIDKVLQISIPKFQKQQVRRASTNDIKEEIDHNKMNLKRKTWYVDNKNQDQLENSKLKINMSQIICEFPIQRIARSSIKDKPKTPSHQKSFMEAIISRYQEKKEERSIEKNERNYLFQDQQEIVKQFKQQEQINQVLTIDDGGNSGEFYEEQPEEIVKPRAKRPNSRKAPAKKKKKQVKPRVSNEQQQQKIYLEKTKEIKPQQNLIQPIFNVKQKWAKMKLRKEAKLSALCKTQEFLDLLLSINGFYLHQSEGELRIDKVKPMQNVKGKYFQSFELWINPLVLIGPLKLTKGVKLHVRFKKGYSGEVFCSEQLQESIPVNQIDGRTIYNQLLLANNSDHVIKLVCCLVNVTIAKRGRPRKI